MGRVNFTAANSTKQTTKKTIIRVIISDLNGLTSTLLVSEQGAAIITQEQPEEDQSADETRRRESESRMLRIMAKERVFGLLTQ